MVSSRLVQETTTAAMYSPVPRLIGWLID